MFTCTGGVWKCTEKRMERNSACVMRREKWGRKEDIQKKFFMYLV